MHLTCVNKPVLTGWEHLSQVWTSLWEIGVWFLCQIKTIMSGGIVRASTHLHQLCYFPLYH